MKNFELILLNFLFIFSSYGVQDNPDIKIPPLPERYNKDIISPSPPPEIRAEKNYKLKGDEHKLYSSLTTEQEKEHYKEINASLQSVQTTVEKAIQNLRDINLIESAYKKQYRFFGIFSPREELETILEHGKKLEKSDFLERTVVNKTEEAFKQVEKIQMAFRKAYLLEKKSREKKGKYNSNLLRGLIHRHYSAKIKILSAKNTKELEKTTAKMAEVIKGIKKCRDVFSSN